MKFLILAGCLQIAGAVLDVDFALVGDGELRFLAGELLPAGQVLAVEEGVGVEGLQLDVAQL